MKKTYISPSACSIRMQFQGMLATSIEPTSIDLDKNEGHAGNEMFSSKREDIWGNEQKGLWD